MSSSVSSTLSAGAQLLASYSNLLPGPSGSEIGAATADPGVQKTLASAHTDSDASGSASANQDTVELSPEALQYLAQNGQPGDAAQNSSHSVHTAYQGFDLFG